MRSFKGKKPEFIAVQWNGNNDEEIAAFFNTKDIAANIKIGEAECLVINYYAGIIRVAINSWVVVYEGGNLTVYKDAFLWENFEEVA